MLQIRMALEHNNLSEFRVNYGHAMYSFFDSVPNYSWLLSLFCFFIKHLLIDEVQVFAAIPVQVGLMKIPLGTTIKAQFNLKIRSGIAIDI